MADVAKAITKQTTETTNPERLLDKLLEFEPASAPVLSLYLDARVDQHGKRNFMPYVRKQLSERAKSYELRAPERESFDRDAERITAYFENGIDPALNGLVYDEEEVKKVLKLYEPDQPLPDDLNERIIADELVRRANLLSSARVTFIEDDTRLNQLGGVGGLLRYRISDETANGK